MANTSYGTVRPANFNPVDAEVIYTYQIDRYTESDGILRTLDSQEVLIPQRIIFEDTNVVNINEIDFLGGLYTLKLPADEFSEKGIYNIIIKPRELITNITDCGVLESLPNVKGIILDLNDQNLEGKNNFDGYRIEYFNNNNTKDKNLFRIVTSTARVEPVSTNISSSVSQKTIKYRLNENGSFVFLTLTPSAINNNDTVSKTPFIGEVGQQISMSNTFFDPVMIEIDMVEEDIETLANALLGNQIKSVGDGRYYLYDKDGNVLSAYNLFETVNEFGETEYEFREKIDEVDNSSENYNAIKNSVL